MNETQEPGAATVDHVLLLPGSERHAPVLTDLLCSLTPMSAFYRFLSGIGEPKPAMVRRLLARDATHGAWLAHANGAVPGAAPDLTTCLTTDRMPDLTLDLAPTISPGSAPRGRTTVGHGCWTLSPDGVVDVGLVVADAWQRRGIGRRLLEVAVLEAVAAGATRLHLDVHPENRRIVAMLRRRLPRPAFSFADGLVQVDVDVRAVVGSGPFPDLVDRVGDEVVGLAVHGGGAQPSRRIIPRARPAKAGDPLRLNSSTASAASAR